jgi:hypothetical protein
MSVLLFISRQQFNNKKKSRHHISYLRRSEAWRLEAMVRLEHTDYKMMCVDPHQGQLLFDQSNLFLAREELLRRGIHPLLRA